MRPVSNHFNTTSSPAAHAQHSPWHSPVPYLFGGLAAMLGLIAFALLILACSYWKLSGYLEDGDSGERDAENSDAKPSDSMKIPSFVMEARVVVMAGDEKPTYLAMPISAKPSYQEKKDDQEEEQEQQQKETPKEREENQEPCNPNP